MIGFVELRNSDGSNFSPHYVNCNNVFSVDYSNRKEYASSVIIKNANGDKEEWLSHDYPHVLISQLGSEKVVLTRAEDDEKALNSQNGTDSPLSNGIGVGDTVKIEGSDNLYGVIKASTFINCSVQFEIQLYKRINSVLLSQDQIRKVTSEVERAISAIGVRMPNPPARYDEVEKKPLDVAKVKGDIMKKNTIE